MKRHRQTFAEIESSLMPVEATWMDQHAEDVIKFLRKIPSRKRYTCEEVGPLLEKHFETATTSIRLFLDLSKDDFTQRMRDALGEGGIGILRYKKEPKIYLSALEALGLPEAMTTAVNQKTHWSDILVERLKGGRGSAIKGQTRGRGMEDFVERIVLKVFQKQQVAVRCRFAGAKGQSDEKADFAIPGAKDPSILIEVKAYGATGSKQTDVLGDIARIVDQKRHDTDLLLVTDGITWRQRPSDLKKLVALQNEGKITKIYTKSMEQELHDDLLTLRAENGL